MRTSVLIQLFLPLVIQELPRLLVGFLVQSLLFLLSSFARQALVLHHLLPRVHHLLQDGPDLGLLTNAEPKLFG